MSRDCVRATFDMQPHKCGPQKWMVLGTRWWLVSGCVAYGVLCVQTLETLGSVLIWIFPT